MRTLYPYKSIKASVVKKAKFSQNKRISNWKIPATAGADYLVTEDGDFIVTEGGERITTE